MAPPVAVETPSDLHGKPRLTRALAVRDHLVPLIYADGRIQGGNLPFMGLKIGPYQMALNTPKVPFPVGLPWQFDLWGPDGSKLLGLEWEDDGKIEVRDFQAGEWYGVVLTLPGNCRSRVFARSKNGCRQSGLLAMWRGAEFISPA